MSAGNLTESQMADLYLQGKLEELKLALEDTRRFWGEMTGLERNLVLDLHATIDQYEIEVERARRLQEAGGG